MHLRDLDPESIASIQFNGRCYQHHGDQRWFRATHPQLPVMPMLNGNYFGHRLLVTMRPRQDPIIHQDKFASSSAAFNSTGGV